jgi:hypothetical protein
MSENTEAVEAAQAVFSFDHWLSGDMGVDALLECSEQHGKLAIAQALRIKAAQ